MALDPSITRYDSHDTQNFENGEMSVSDGTTVHSNAQIADYLVNGYWEDSGRAARSFDVETGGTLTYNITLLDGTGQAAARKAFEAWSSVSGLIFQETTASDAQIRFDDNNSGAYAQSSIYSTGEIAYSSINIHASWKNYGDYYHQTYMHEIGHALGLGHTGNYNGQATYGSDARYLNDSWQTSVMSYFSQQENTWTDASLSYLATLQLGDIAAIQQIYGTPVTVNTSDTVYGDGTGLAQLGMDLTGMLAVAIVDSGGVDTINLASRTHDQVLNLEAESYSDLNGRKGNFSIGRETVIENAITGSGDDHISGNHVNNILEAGEGSDTLLGRDGNDILLGGAGSDWLTGGLGADKFAYVSVADAGDVITDFSLAEGDTVDVSVLLVALSYAGEDAIADGTFALTAFGSGAVLLLTHESLTYDLAELSGVAADADLYQILDVEGRAPEVKDPDTPPEPAVDVDSLYVIDSTFSAIWNEDVSIIEDTNGGNDTIDASGLTSSSTVSLASGGAGQIDGHALTIAQNTEIENLILGAGRDKAYGNALNNWIDGGAGADLIFAALGDDTLYGGKGHDRLFGGAGSDILDGGLGWDHLYGGDGDDLLHAGEGNNVLGGGEGNDTLHSGAGDDTITAGAGHNVINSGDGANVVRAADGDNTVSTGSGWDRIFLGHGNNMVQAGEGPNLVRVGHGHNQISSGEGGARVIAGDGNNIMLLSGGANRVTAGSGDNTVTTGAGHDKVIARGGANWLDLGSGNNLAATGAGNDTVLTGDGNNQIYAGDGANVISTGAGLDTIYTGLGDDIIYGGDGSNIIGAKGGNNFILTGFGNDRVVTGAGHDEIYLGAGDNMLRDSGGNNVVESSSGDDRIFTHDGDDLIFAGDGANSIFAGHGQNRVETGSGADTIVTGAGDDTIISVNGANVVTAGRGDNFIVTGDGADTILTYGGNDLINAGEGDNSVKAFAGNNTIATGQGKDAITTGAGADYISSGGGSDRITSGGGNDTLVGGAGADTLTGGDGADIFVFSGVSDQSNVVTDFNPFEGDRIGVSGVLFDLGTSLDRALAEGFLFFASEFGSTSLFVRDAIDAEVAATSVAVLEGFDGQQNWLHEWFIA